MTTDIDTTWLDFLSKIYTVNKTVTTTKVTIKTLVPIDTDSVIAIPVDKLIELRDNLIYSGFTEAEALSITTQVASNATI